MKGPFKLKYKHSAFPFKTDDTNKEIEDIRNKLDWDNKSEIPYKDLQDAFYQQKERNKREEKKEKHMKYYGDFGPGNYPA